MSLELETYQVPERLHKRPKLGRKAKIVLGLAATSLVLGAAYSQKDKYTDDLADISRSLIGDNNTARLETIYFDLHDRKDRLIYEITGNRKSPFSKDYETPVLESASPEPQPEVILTNNETQQVEQAPIQEQKPQPLILPEIQYLGVPLKEGEGIWRTDELPRTTAEDPLMAKTVIRPDKARPDATVAVLLIDKRRARLHMVGGTESPGGDRGVPGPGKIPKEHLSDLLAAWNGGFKGPHGGFGMYADGKFYRPLRNGLASIAVSKDGTISMGEWGHTISWDDSFAAVRQNNVPLVENCGPSKRIYENNNTWGYVVEQSQENVTRRSAVGLTLNGDLLVAAGDKVKPDTLAYALWAAGACKAMQLDMNTPQTNTSLYFQKPDGSIEAKGLTNWIPEPRRFLSTQSTDFMYITHDESNYK